MIHDQRSMTGATWRATVDEVVAAWTRFGARRPSGWLGRTHLIGSDQPLHAYVNHSRWVADCPCAGGVACWSENPLGACLSCGTTYPIVFPDNAPEIEAVLLERPDPDTRNWLLGETVDVLVAENHSHL